jgi:hypothetical protein
MNGVKEAGKHRPSKQNLLEFSILHGHYPGPELCSLASGFKGMTYHITLDGELCEQHKPT